MEVCYTSTYSIFFISVCFTGNANTKSQRESMNEIIDRLKRKNFTKDDGVLYLKKRPYDAEDLGKYILNKGMGSLELAAAAQTIIDEFPESMSLSAEPMDNVQWCKNYIERKQLKFNYDGTVKFKASSRPFKMDMFIAKMKNDAYQAGLKNYDRIIDNELTLAQGNSQLDWRDSKLRELAFTPGIAHDIDKFVTALSDEPEIHDLHVAAVKHWIWQVKRKLRNMPVEYHMMINWYGPSNSGKTLSVTKLFSPLQDAVYNANNLNIIKDDRFGKVLQEHPVIMLDELAGADKVTAEELKAAITSPTWTYRIMHSNQMSKAQNIGTFISTSNIHINCMILDPKSARRYWQVVCKPRETLKNHWDELKQLNYADMWRSVDELSPTPLTPFLDRILEHQNNELKAESFMKMFLRESYSVDEDNEDPVFPHQLPLRRLEKDFREWKNDRRIPCRDTSQFIRNELMDLGHDVVSKDKQKYVIIETQVSFQSALQEIDL